MSLLMDALKQAEQNKVKDRQPTTEPVSGPGPEQTDHQEVPDIGTSGDPPSETIASSPNDAMPVHDHNIDELFEAELRISETENTDIEITKGVPPIVQALAEDIVEEPLAAELDFSEIEATITANSRIAESDLQVVDAASVDTINLLQASDQSAGDEQVKIAALSGGDKTVTVTPALSMHESREALTPGRAHPADSQLDINTPADAEKILAASRKREDVARKRQFLMLGILVTTILILIVGYYFWARALNVQPAVLPGTLSQSEPLDTEQEGQRDTTNSEVILATNTSPRSNSSDKVKLPVQTVALPQMKTVKKPQNKPVNRVARTPVKKPEPLPPRRRADSPSIYQLLSTAYQAYQGNRILVARDYYQQVLTRQPRNRDALLGLAAVAVRQGYNDEAQSLYRRQLELDPKDGTAQTGLLNLLSTGDSGANESLIKQMLRKHGETAYLRFALGNAYAAQLRWEEAQRSYFRAYSAAPQNANYLFNLAVSLDHLHQDRMALQYYQWAIDMAAGQVAKFDIEAARQRVQILSASVSAGQS